MATSTLGRAKPPTSQWQGEAKPELLERVRNDIPADRYEMAGGCYAVRDAAGGYVVREGAGFAATASDRSSAERFHFQATDLGTYLLFARDETFIAASEGALGEAAYAVTKSQPGNMAGGVAREETDKAADEIARSDANRGAGRGANVEASPSPTELADWEVAQIGPGSFALTLPATDQGLASGDGGALSLVDRGGETPLAFELAEGCAEFPEIEVNVDGAPLGGKADFQEVRGYFDAHLHMMAYEFLGGRARCGRPWHRFGVAHALVDCEDHKPGGHGAILEQVLTKQNPGTPHNTDGWPTFEGWPTHYSLTHEQVYYRWLERAWRGGLRMFTNLLVDNNKLCEAYPYKRNSCNEMDGVRLQRQRIEELERYIDAQHGGEGKGWFRIVTDPFEARRVINEGKLAVILGIEVSVPLDCGLRLDDPQCDETQIDERLQEVYDLGVRQMELVNKFDNALSGVAGDAGDTGVIVNGGNFLETGRFWQMDTCEDVTQHEHGDHSHEGEAHDKTQHNFHDFSGAPDEFSGRDALAGGVLALAGTSGAAPVYPEGPHCNQRGLSELGEAMIRGMVERDMIFDPDHMSALAQEQAMNLIDSLGHSGVVSSHGWSNDVIYQRVYEAGGVVTPYAGGSAGFVDKWRQHKQWADPRFYFGFGYGADTNGFGSQGGPRSNAAENPVTYPFTGLGGVIVDQQQSGTRTTPYDINTDGVAHYGLYPDWIEDLRRQAGDEIVDDMARGAEAYLQMWERAMGIKPDACRFDVADLTDEQMAAVRRGMTAEEVARAVGQPATRTASAFEYCMTEQRVATVRFTGQGEVATWKAKRIK